MRALDANGRKILDTAGLAVQTTRPLKCGYCCNCVTYISSVHTDGGGVVCGFPTSFTMADGPYFWDSTKILKVYDLYKTFPNIVFARNTDCTAIPSCGEGLPRLYPASLTIGPFDQDIDLWSLTRIWVDDALAIDEATPGDCEGASWKYAAGSVVLSLATGNTATLRVYETFGILTTAFGLLGAVPSGVDPHCETLP